MNAPCRPPSLIGVRAEFRCAACGDMQRVHQTVSALDPVFNLPPGWVLREGRTFCEEHVPVRIKETRSWWNWRFAEAPL